MTDAEGSAPMIPCHQPCVWCEEGMEPTGDGRHYKASEMIISEWIPAINTTIHMVHYTAGNPAECHHAKILEHLDDAGQLYLRVHYNDSLGHFHTATTPDPNPDQRTPGHWHPWHEEQQ